MSKVDVLNWKKEKVGTVDLNSDVFSTEVKKELLHTVVNWQLASRRQGTHMVKTRSLVSGGGKKPFKQKGTGGARQGSTRSPLMPGGAKLFGPIPRTYEFALPKKIRRLGLRMALSHLNKQGKLFVVADMSSEGKTAELAKRLKAFGATKALLVDSKIDDKFKQASNNLATYKYSPVDGLNVFDLLKYDMAILTKDSVDKVVERCLAE
ncbi:MAG: 50S ribosomal protein L4 [Oligoflexia bacterium]|nr:MAG: 50S ribosomal protein L4 [Oligoflexia bacterium]